MPPSVPERLRPRCRLLVAAAGYGKTTALRGWVTADGARWYRGSEVAHGRQVVAAVVAAAQAGRGGGEPPPPLVIDDGPRLTTEDVSALAAAVDELPETASVVIASRCPPAVPAARWPGRRQWAEAGPADLALATDEIADVLVEVHGLAGPASADDLYRADLAAQVRAATGGWPALVHLAAETMRLDGVPSGDLVPAVTRVDSPLATYLAAEVLGPLPPEAVELLRQVGDLTPVTAGLCELLGLPQAAQSIDLLRRTGLLIRTGAPPDLPGAPAPVERIVPVVAAAAPHRRTGGRRIAAVAAGWYERNGPAVAAARAYHRAGDDEGSARVLAGHGDRMIAAGQAAAVAELVAALPHRRHTRRLRLLQGDALRTLGDLDAAGRAYAAAGATGAAGDPGLAWRLGRIHYQRGDARAALAAFAAGADQPGPAADTILLLAWTAHAHLLAGEVETATGHALAAVAAATGTDPTGAGADREALDRALATAHLSVALCRSVAGDAAGSEEHYALALPVAQRTGDVLLLTRIHTNRTYQLLRTARFADALGAAQLSARYAAAGGSPSLEAIAACNEADALAMLGRFDEAVARYRAALSRYQRQGSRRFAGALLGLGELYRRLGWREQARAAYEEAVRVTEDSGNAHVRVPALAGLALVLLDDDPKAAAVHAEQAAEPASGEIVGPALLAQGWVARDAGDAAQAARLAAEAAGIARAQRDRAGLADALELRAATEDDPARLREALREAHAIWTDAGAAVEAARLAVALGGLPDASADDRLAGLLAQERLAAAGARPDRAGTISTAPGQAGREVAVRALGRFEVLVGGESVPASQWQSRKARDLLRILVARRGRPVPRDELSELLWPDDDPGRTGHRLSVLLSIARGVLDPGRSRATDHFVVAHQGSIALDRSHLRVDVEEFLAQVGHGRRLLERDCLPEAHAVLLAADRQYRADVFEDEPYDDWAAPLQEQARAAYLNMLRMLARTSRATAGPAPAAEYLLRLLERDPYDEPAHRGLVRVRVAAGQHGEARRAFQRYRRAMREIGVRAPDETILVPARTTAQ